MEILVSGGVAIIEWGETSTHLFLEKARELRAKLEKVPLGQIPSEKMDVVQRQVWDAYLYFKKCNEGLPDYILDIQRDEDERIPDFILELMRDAAIERLEFMKDKKEG